VTSLAVQQQGLLDLIKGRTTNVSDPYLRDVAGCRELAMLREIAVWWRKVHVESQCRFTSRLLKRMRNFDSVVSAYFNENATSPFVEELALDFLRTLRDDPDPLVRAVSQFECALQSVRLGSADVFEVTWDRHPDLVIRALEQASEMPAAEVGCIYRMKVANDIPGLIACTRMLTRSATASACE